MRQRKMPGELSSEDRQFRAKQKAQDYKKRVNDKIQATKTRAQRMQTYNTAKMQSNQKVPTSNEESAPLFKSKSEQNLAAGGKKYFKSDFSRDAQAAEVQQQLPTNNTDTSNKEYLKLHEELNSIQSKITSIKNKLQNKRELKIKKQKQKQEQRREKTNKARPKLQSIVTSVPERAQFHAFDANPYSPRHSIYYVSEVVRAYKDQKSLARQHIQTSLQIMAYFQRFQIPEQAKIQSKKVNLGRRKGYEDKKTVVFDLDETLIHCNQSLEYKHDVKLPIIFPTGQVIEAGINIRPYAVEILEKLSKNFEIIVFTASHSCYANVVLDFLDPSRKFIHHRLFREHCYTTPEGMYVKDLRVINRSLKDMVLIDNAAYSYIYQPDNGIPIIPYYHGNSDYELQALQTYIESMLLVSDVRAVNRKTFKLQEYNNYYNQVQKLVDQLYLPEHSN